MKYYNGRVPACGIFCGGCPVFVREKKSCPGAEINLKRCEKCKSFHLCCQDRGITHCYECETYPCRRLKDFAKRWEKYGQKALENQERMKKYGVEKFLEHYNSKV